MSAPGDGGVEGGGSVGDGSLVVARSATFAVSRLVSGFGDHGRNAAAESIGIPGLTPHELRHTCATPCGIGRRQQYGSTDSAAIQKGTDPQLSWSPLSDSNRRPPLYKSGALAN